MRVAAAVKRNGNDANLASEKRQRRVIVLSTALVGSVAAMITAVTLLFIGGSSQISDFQVTSAEDTQQSKAPQTAPTSKEAPMSSVTTMTPTLVPSLQPSSAPSFTPPTLTPLHVLSETPSNIPSDFPSSRSSMRPSLAASERPTLINATYTPGWLTISENNLILSEGLTSRVIAESGRFVGYSSGKQSAVPFHVLPDFGATFIDPRPSNTGGWIYVSNSEVKDFEQFSQKGGVGALTFDAKGRVIDYRMVLEGTEANCGGGRTTWGAWISCEEHSEGAIWQVDPTGVREAQRITLGSGHDAGNFESFASHGSHFFVTEDAESGPLRRFTPDPTTTNWTDPWSVLLGAGLTEYLLLYPDSPRHGTYAWTTNKEIATDNSKMHYRNSEGIDVVEDRLFFVSKVQKEMFILDLSSNSYTVETTEHGLFDGDPDQVTKIVGDDELLFFTEEGGSNAGGK